MKTVGYFVLGISSLSLCTSAFAAQVTSIEGVLQVNTGSGFQKIARSTEVAPGGSVMVSPEGKAEILYSDGCRIPLGAGSVAVVAPVSPCAKGQAVDQNDRDYTAYYVAGGVAAAAGLGVGIWALTKKKSDNNVIVTNPASP